MATQPDRGLFKKLNARRKKSCNHIGKNMVSVTQVWRKSPAGCRVELNWYGFAFNIGTEVDERDFQIRKFELKRLDHDGHHHDHHRRRRQCSLACLCPLHDEDRDLRRPILTLAIWRCAA